MSTATEPRPVDDPSAGDVGPRVPTSEVLPPTLSVPATIRRFAPLVAGLRWRLALAVICHLVQVGNTVVTVALFAHIVDDVLVTGDLSALSTPMMIWVGVSILGAVSSYAGGILTAGVTETVLLRLRGQLYAHIQRLAPHTRDRFGDGDLVSRTTADVEAVDSLVSSGVVSGVVATVSLLVYGAAAFATNWQLALVAAVLAPLLWVTARRFGAVVKRASRRERQAAGRISSLVAEGIGNMVALQADNQTSHHRARVLEQNRRWRESRMSESRAGAAFAEAVTVVEVLCMVVVIAFGAWLIAGGDAQLGTLIALTGYLGYLYPQIQVLGGLLVEVTSATASAERVAEVLDAPAGVAEPIAPESLAPEPGVTDPIPARRPVAPASVRLSLTGVSFAYPDNGSRVFEDAHLEIRAGETVAVTGPSGVGKSTLTRLLLRLYDPDAGSIRLNGTDIRHLDVSDLREHLSVLHQRPALMRGTIADNIRFGCTTATRADIAAAARAAGAAEFISRLNGGLDAEVVERGENLSGGQQQRIALARTILRNRPVLVLDEPTTGLDDETVSGILEPLARVASLRTTILITHDPRVLELADRTLELRDGRFADVAPVAPWSGEGALVERPRTVQLVLPVQP
ncbi:MULTISPECIES: ABC transporter ATP-binding protein [unclassified Gordonia (in: high G+C Gram-positive bacteria)]|uniref:ABC transporter ATP-binding protein n=1 Tax=unclassified Gordonia (in: high G+C Gram-positive bacteria) TaxID=2657482 RepID=UPI00099125EC|nr:MULTISPECIES: ABC transporter ATP-binding protein [unclassified Gordonia (in: high G+C Gram-positive bacteria)]MBR7191010.1 ABC transporter ATP-binding protein [Gordonia sp. SCSIO 19800]